MGCRLYELLVLGVGTCSKWVAHLHTHFRGYVLVPFAGGRDLSSSCVATRGYAHLGEHSNGPLSIGGAMKGQTTNAAMPTRSRIASTLLSACADGSGPSRMGVLRSNV
jgi:hypothetical protein